MMSLTDSVIPEDQLKEKTIDKIFIGEVLVLYTYTDLYTTVSAITSIKICSPLCIFGVFFFWISDCLTVFVSAALKKKRMYKKHNT